MQYQLNSPEEKEEFAKQMVDYMAKNKIKSPKTETYDELYYKLLNDLKSKKNIKKINIQGMDGFKYTPVNKKASYNMFIQNKTIRLLKQAAENSWWDNVKSSVKKGWNDFNEYADKNEWVRPALGALTLGGTGFGVGSIWGRKAAIIAGLLSAATGGTTGYLLNPTQDTNTTQQPKAQKVGPDAQSSKQPAKAVPTANKTSQNNMQQVSADLKKGKSVLSPGQEFMLYDAIPATTMAGGYAAGSIYDNMKTFNRRLAAENLIGQAMSKGRPVSEALRERFLRRYPEEKSLVKSLTRPTKGHYKSIGSVTGLFLGALPSLFAPSPYRADK